MIPAGDFIPSLTDAFARGALMALGPGCHRVSYDESIRDASGTPVDPWSTVVHRMRLIYAELEREHADAWPDEDRSGSAVGGQDPRTEQQFLQRFLWSKLSEEERQRKERNGRIDDARHSVEPGDSEMQPQAGQSLDRWRTLIARHVLGAFIGSTRLLGSAIEEDQSPVIEWTRVAVGRAAAPDVAQARREAFGRVGHHIKMAAALARCAGLRENDYRRTDSDFLGEYPDLRECVVQGDTTAAELERLRLADVAAFLERLHELCFGADSRERLTGAVVEWLGDLLWHLVVRGSQLPPSEMDVAFYLNLQYEEPFVNMGHFSRPRPGDVRAHNPQIAERLAELFEECTRLPSELHVIGWQEDLLRIPEKVALSLAATLVTFWREKKVTGGGVPGKVPIALVTGYDLMLETALMRCLDRGESFHVVIPAKVDGTVRWLLGSFTQSGSINRLDNMVRNAKWRPIDVLPQLIHPRNEVHGPIVIKLHGSPLHQAEHGEPIAGNLYRLAGEKEPDVADELFSDDPVQSTHSAWDSDLMAGKASSCIAYSETDVLEVMNAFDSIGASGRMLGSSLRGELSWSARSWVFLGHRFADWLARFRLFNLQRTSARSSDQETLHWAVDRAFNYPERTLLTAFRVTEVQHDLAQVVGYWRRARPQSDAVVQFKADVEDLYTRVVGGQ